MTPRPIHLSYRPPYDWAGMQRFLGDRALAGVECVREEAYARTLRLDGHAGWLEVRNAPVRGAIRVAIAPELAPVLPVLRQRLRHLFDLSARPEIIGARLAQDSRLAGLVARRPGLRVPGACDGFEMAMRAILGQQITVKAATTIAGRLVRAFGEPIATPIPGLDRLCPTPERIAQVRVERIAALGIIRQRAASLIALAREVHSGRLVLEAGADPERTIAQLIDLPGIGSWTAHYIAMRALRWTDAFPKEDIAVRRALGGVKAAQAEAAADAWRPWRSYAILHLWQGGASAATPARKKLIAAQKGS
jgi:AraC family transcriptional regulator, regulatory protein of adaptative response / DNA-3-methyladenine glycosylase II